MFRIRGDRNLSVVERFRVELQSKIEAKHPKTCLNCGLPFLSKHKDTLFCSKKCKDREWRQRNPQYSAELRKRNPQYYYEKVQNWCKRHRRERVAQTAANEKINIKNESCSKCGSKQNLHRHHPDYDKKLSVVILCAKCHSRFHHEGKT